MITVLNPEADVQDLVLSLNFEGGVYILPVHLNAGATYMVNVGDIISMQEPDSQGSKIPPDTTYGTATISGKGGFADPITVGVSIGVFNVNTATCGTRCPTCFGYTDFFVQPINSSALPGTNASFRSMAMGQDNFLRDVSTMPGVNWSSSNSVVAQSQGGGIFTGETAGSFLALASGFLLTYPQDCAGTGSPCPTDFFNGDYPGTVGAASPIQHSYPYPPLTSCRVSNPFDAIVGTGKTHKAQDTVAPNIRVGTPVFAPESGTIVAHRSGQPHDPRTAKQCSGQGTPADFVQLLGSDGSFTTFVHVTILASLSNGSTVSGGQEIGTIDLSGCTSAEHTHVIRRVGGIPVNFTMPCDNSHFDNPTGYYDDSDSTIP
jgi:murein DD-endopeptidase MepM/ murein hydrolase activator NlpD